MNRTRYNLICNYNKLDVNIYCSNFYTTTTQILCTIFLNTRNSNKWPEVVSEDLKKHVYKLKDRVFVINGQIKGQTLLSFPVGIELVEEGKKIDIARCDFNKFFILKFFKIFNFRLRTLYRCFISAY